ncbi:SMP-30/gluconolactonase/LRE family protein [Cohnella herbarum]|uniref:SMP-30/gluconolactonase/LRE family protein n=1 Tax=Cohnella herbarum TaxID=2728023 RepID=A0A7Z2VRP4_9BACL|nr:SMP-30/gluconolactonase/LRE family protein [Cohnella herbarum]QJD87929.1 SMP-30/gluconolactonase/LRE family protein [Cohnella herbarum]
MDYVSAALTLPGSFTSGIEGPACDGAGNLYAVNYEKQATIGRITPQGDESIFIELPNGSIGNGIRFNREGDMFIADFVHHNIWKVDMSTRHLSIHAHEPRMNQPNDIAISNKGVIYASDPNWDDGTGNMWRIDTDGTVTLLEANMGTTNGIETSPDDTVLYVNETVQRRIWAYDLNKDGEISNKRLLIEFPDHLLDGMRCDMLGNLYVTRFGKGVIAVISPTGQPLREIGLEGTDCTNLTFGGPEGKHCYVTVSDVGNVQVFTVEHPGRCWGMWK